MKQWKLGCVFVVHGSSFGRMIFMMPSVTRMGWKWELNRSVWVKYSPSDTFIIAAVLAVIISIWLIILYNKLDMDIEV